MSAVAEIETVDPYDLSDAAYRAVMSAIIHLLLNEPFFGQLVSRLDLVLMDDDSWCRTAATDGKHLYVNKTFVLNCTQGELLFAMGHEVLHCLYDHIGRRMGRDPKLWNYAIDFIVNYVLTEAKIGTRRATWLYDKRFTDDMSAEEVYAILVRQSTEVEIEFPDLEQFDQHLDAANDNSGDGGSGDSSDDDDDGDGDGDGEGTSKGKPRVTGKGGSNKVKMRVTGKNGPPKLTKEDISGIRDRMVAAAIQAVQSCAAGEVPAGILRQLGKLIEPKLDWRALLDSHLRSAFRADFTFQRFNRRNLTDFLLPTQDVLQIVEVDIAVDASGSMTEEMLRDIFSEVKGIMQSFGDFKLRVWTFDTRVYNFKEFTPHNLYEIDEYAAMAHGGGGTLFECNWEFMRDKGITPHRLVVFTDGFPCRTWGDSNYCETLFVIHGDPHQKIKAPFGMTAWYEAPEKFAEAA